MNSKSSSADHAVPSLSFPSPCIAADAVGGWAVEACEQFSGLAAAPPAKALVQLALRGRARIGGGDLQLLHDLAADLKAMVNTEEEGEGEDEGERFAALNRHTYKGVLAVMGTHLDATMG